MGQLGNGTKGDSLTPAPVSGIAGATSLSSGYSHACVGLGDGAVRCWGANDAGQLGDGGSAYSSPLPVTVLGL